MSDRPSVSVIVVSWNALDHLQRFLPSVARSTYPNLEIVLADNASTDGSSAWVQEHLPSVRIVRHPENWKFCRGNNVAIDQTTSDFVVLLNNDVEVPPDWLEPLVAVMERDAHVAAVQPKLLQYSDPTAFEYAGACGGFLDDYGYPFARGRLFDTLERDRGQYDDARDVFWGSGAALLLRRRALDEVGLLDEAFEMHMEEIDLCWRFWRAGWRVRVEPSSRVYHLGGGSLAAGDAQKTFYNFRNSFLLLRKHFSRSQLRRVVPIRYALDTLAGAHAVGTGRPKDLAAIFKAHRAYRRMGRSYPWAVGPSIQPPYRGSVVVDYFARRRTTFADLPETRFRM